MQAVNGSGTKNSMPFLHLSAKKSHPIMLLLYLAILFEKGEPKSKFSDKIFP